MTTQEIPRKDWPEFSQAFSQRHDNWLVTLEVMGSEIGAQVEGRGLRLRGLSADTSQEGSNFALMLETANGDHLTHVVAAPTHVWLEQAPDGADVALEIQSADGTNTLVTFRSAVRPETVDGIMPAIDRHK
jgi:hypothetical protein